MTLSLGVLNEDIFTLYVCSFIIMNFISSIRAIGDLMIENVEYKKVEMEDRSV